MPSLSPLNDLTVDLFLYDLVESLGKTADEIEAQRLEFWRRIYSEDKLTELLPSLTAETTQFSAYIEPLGKKRIEPLDEPWDGYYYPVKLNDAYALLLDCSGKKDSSDWQELPFTERLRQTQQKVIEATQNRPGTLGQSWLIWGRLKANSPAGEQVAKSCYCELPGIDNPDWERDLQGKGEWQGATFFEVEQKDAMPDGENRNHYYLFCFFPPEIDRAEVLERISQLSRHLLPLFHYRNKILWTYEQNYAVKSAIKRASATVQKLVDSLATSLEKPRLDLPRLQKSLGNALSISYYCETQLSYFQEQMANLEINAENHNSRLAAIAKLDPQSNLEFWEAFTQYSEERVQQLSRDRDTLNVGLKPLESFIKTVRGIVEIEQTKNERTLNQTIAIASVGISTASLAAATFPFEQATTIVRAIYPPVNNTSNSPAYITGSFAFTFLGSLMIGLLSAAITAYFLGLKLRR